MQQKIIQKDLSLIIPPPSIIWWKVEKKNFEFFLLQSKNLFVFIIFGLSPKLETN
jgi:hypothetical protein